jgi:hypothetical protein
MLHFYYPLSSQKFTFENIFSSESVSPPFFYEKRGFGIGYFNVLPNVNHNEAIILFNNPPAFDVENGIKFILQISASCLDMDDMIVLDEGVFAYQKTIYLNKFNFKINFFSEKDRKITLLRAETSLPTKNLDKYAENFTIIEANNCVQYKFNNSFIGFENEDYDNQILIDKKYNQFKGFIYGIIGGLFSNKSKEEILFRKLMREIVNSFAEFKSRAVDSRFSYSKNTYKRTENKESQVYENKLLDVLELMKQAYFDFFSDANISDDLLFEILLEKIKRFKSIDEVKHYINNLYIEDEIFGTKKIEEIKYIYSKQVNSASKNILLEKLQSQIKLFIDGTLYNKTKVDLSELNNDIKTTFYEIENSIYVNLRNKNSEIFSLVGLDYDFEKSEILIHQSFQNLDSDEARDIALIINIIFRFSENKGVQQKNLILDIVKEVGKVFSKAGKETLLYQYLNNEIDTYAIEKISNSVLKNFVAFVFNIASLEKLEKFIESKNIENAWMAYSFWGAYNGFANLSGNFTKYIFSENGKAIQIYLDEYLAKYFEILDDINLHKNNVSHNNSMESPIGIFYQKFVSGKYNLSLEEFSRVVPINDKDDFYKELKLKFKMTKKNSEKLFNCIRKDFDLPLLFN